MVSLCNPGWAQFPKCWDYRSTPPGLSVSSHFFLIKKTWSKSRICILRKNSSLHLRPCYHNYTFLTNFQTTNFQKISFLTCMTVNEHMEQEGKNLSELFLSAKAPLNK
jgi:hypothetical protein